MKNTFKGLKTFFILWSTQSLSQLGSAMTAFALTLWLYEKTGSALQTALLSVCSYAPYVVMSIFAGALSDRWDKKKTMLVCDTLAACCSVIVLILLKADLLLPVHLYILNAVGGLMNTVQQPASDVAMTLIIPKEQYQRTSGLRSLSNSLVTILSPVFAAALFAIAGMDGVILADLGTFAAAFLSLMMFVKIPAVKAVKDLADEGGKSLLNEMKAGLVYLRQNKMILTLILFMAGVNFAASAFDAVLPPYVLSMENGGENVLGTVTACAGVATLAGSIMVTFLPAPKNRVRVIYLTMLFSLGTENFVLAFARTPVWWCLAQVIGWILVPVMSANLDVILRSTVPAEIQGRVYSCRNTFQFFTIPVGMLFGGALVESVCEPIMKTENNTLSALFGVGNGAGCALAMFILGILGIIICLGFGGVLSKYKYSDEKGKSGNGE